ncbi:putative glycolipid-binding domain-containing protein [Streptomyces sp. NPDC006638]|uniref:putative glycolipid-binding domain-containing protein n=1 Tax=Streptomyces sp. NPDC006638 TaxID=3157183 RepID=UPI0033BA1723
MAASHVLTWDVRESKGYETGWVTLDGDRLDARGRAVGTTPEPYWLSYELDTGPGFVTRALRVGVESAAGTRALDLRRSEDGAWSVDGRPRPELAGALDCDLGLCPLTNSMPVLRHGLHAGPGEAAFLMAWVSVPDLAVHTSRQTYTHLRRTGRGGLVRFTSGDFRRDLEFDTAGLVLDYPDLARRMEV